MSEETEAYLAVKSIDILQASCKSSTLTFTGVKIKRADAAGMRSHRDTGTFSRRGALYRSLMYATLLKTDEHHTFNPHHQKDAHL